MFRVGLSALLYFLVVSMQPFSVFAESPEEKGFAIALEADKRDEGWVDSKVNLKMVLRNARGEESHRQMRLKNLEVEGDVQKLSRRRCEI